MVLIIWPLLGLIASLTLLLGQKSKTSENIFYNLLLCTSAAILGGMVTSLVFSPDNTSALTLQNALGAFAMALIIGISSAISHNELDTNQLAKPFRVRSIKKSIALR